MLISLLLAAGFILMMPDVAAAQGDGGSALRRQAPLWVSCCSIVIGGLSALWVYEDAKARNDHACLWALVAYFVLWPVGLIGYLFFWQDKPEPVDRIHLPQDYYPDV